jgi:hypothetical protein
MIDELHAVCLLHELFSRAGCFSPPTTAGCSSQSKLEWFTLVGFAFHLSSFESGLMIPRYPTSRGVAFDCVPGTHTPTCRGLPGHVAFAVCICGQVCFHDLRRLQRGSNPVELNDSCVVTIRHGAAG